MATASDEFLVRFRYWLVSGGMMTRIACGITTSRSVRPDAGRARRGLASVPWLTPRMPARTISAIKAAV